MSVEKTEIETFFGRCRCCLSCGYLKNMWSEHQFEGVGEIYGEMIVQCFALTWESMEQDQICEQCIGRLREANNFKKLVLKSQGELLQQIAAENEIDIKEEMLVEDSVTEGQGPESEANTDTEYTMDTADTLDSVNDETEYVDIENVEDEDAACTNDTVDTDLLQPISQLRPVQRRKQRRTREQYESIIENMYKLIREVKTILTFTNATPFKTKHIRYHCAYCYTDGPHFEEPDDLRTHTRTEHHSHRTEKIECAMRPFWLNEVIKLDIDNLLCTVCCVVINNLNDMFKHLKEKHNVTLDQAYTRVIPYVLRSDSELKCALCKESFSNFHQLDGHMNAHFNNYVCDDCGDKFLNYRRLKQHVRNHDKQGKFHCRICNKVFTLQQYRKRHEEKVHQQLKKFKCLYCPEKFSGESLRHLHCLEMHKEKVKTITCEICGKSFTWGQYYRNHMRQKHEIYNKAYGCSKCDKKFFSNYELKEHMLRHGGTKNYECPICHKRYVSMTSLKTHGKQHEIDMGADQKFVGGGTPKENQRRRSARHFK